MARLVHSETGMVVHVADEKAERFDASVWQSTEVEKAPAPKKSSKS